MTTPPADPLAPILTAYLDAADGTLENSTLYEASALDSSVYRVLLADVSPVAMDYGPWDV